MYTWNSKKSLQSTLTPAIVKVKGHAPCTTIARSGRSGYEIEIDLLKVAREGIAEKILIVNC